VSVDATNPGQFFACCGLLELADRLWGDAEGWFDDGSFQIASTGTLAEILQSLVAANAEEVTKLSNGLEVKPLIAPLRLTLDGTRPSSLTLDAWMTIKIDKGEVVTVANPPWNFWSGQQTSFRIWRDLRTTLKDQLQSIHPDRLSELFSHRVLLSGRFGFDPGAAWNALDVGFSPNEQGMEVASSAAVEMLAAVGIQRFRPAMAEDRESFIYGTWSRPLPPPVAAAAASGVLGTVITNCFRGCVISRGSYAALGRSIPVRGEDHE
jgi:CRISPR-associated protein Csx14